MANWKADLQERVKHLEDFVGEPQAEEEDSLANKVRTMNVLVGELQDHVVGYDQMAAKLEELSKGLATLTEIVGKSREDSQRVDGEITLIKRAMVQSLGSTDSGVMASKPKIPEPKAYNGERSAKDLENYLWDMEQYFKTAHIKDADMVDIASMYLGSDAKLWWRTRAKEDTRGAVTTWELMKAELRGQFLPTNSSWQARDALRKLRHDGTVRDYVKQFTSLLLDVKDMSDEDKVFNFVAGLQPWAQAELRRQGVKDFKSAVAAADGLMDLRLDRNESVGNKSKRMDKGQTTKDSGKEKATEGKPDENGQKNKGPKAGSGCFICGGPHFARKCPQKEQLAALKSDGKQSWADMVEEEQGEMPRMNCVRVLEPGNGK